MKRNKPIIIIVLIMIVAAGSFFTIKRCYHKGHKQSGIRIQDLKIDINQDLTNLSLQQLRILQAEVRAKNGIMFDDADLIAYFTSKYDDFYDYWVGNFGNMESDKKNEFSKKFSAEEKKFLKKIDLQILERLKQNYIFVGGRKVANTDNIVNLFQMDKYSDEFMNKLRMNNFVIIPQGEDQLFFIYEKNNYRDFPNFITTDLLLQAFHSYYDWVLNSIEKNYFNKDIEQLSERMYTESMNLTHSSDPEIKSNAEFVATYFAIPLGLITSKNPAVPSSFSSQYDLETEHIDECKDNYSQLLDIKDRLFMYSLFKPRGHYTRNKESERYFKSMIWLQTASMCMEKNNSLKHAMLMAYILGKEENKSIRELYDHVYYSICDLVGESDNVSIPDLLSVMKNLGISELSKLYETKTIELVRKALLEIYNKKDRIVPKVINGCEKKIDFMPQRYLPDNEVLANMYDSTRNSEKAYPSGLDIMASFGNKYAEKLLYQAGENKKWHYFNETLNSMKSKFSVTYLWNNSIYTEWLSGLIKLQERDNRYPPFMQTEQWQKKNLNSSLASWAEMKHDVCLYAEEVTGAESGGPSPVLCSYVEPNVIFWKKLIELLDKTSSTLKKYNIYSKDIQTKTEEFKKQTEFLLKISVKELYHVKVTDDEFYELEEFGGEIEHLTLSILEPDTTYYEWFQVKGPDRSVAVATDIFTRNIPKCDKNGILHAANGMANSIYVIAEINGYLFICRGAVLNYYEFIEKESRLTDEEWQKSLRKNEAPPLPDWMKEIMLNDKEIIQHDKNEAIR